MCAILGRVRAMPAGGVSFEHGGLGNLEACAEGEGGGTKHVHKNSQNGNLRSGTRLNPKE